MPTRIIHFSDPQIVPAGEMNYDIDPQARLKLCIDAILSHTSDVDACFITGDLTHWGETKAYTVLKQELDRLPFPVYMMMGNHDHRQSFLSVFNDHPVCDQGFIQYALDMPCGRFICLDTLDKGKRGGILCEQRLVWLEGELNSTSEPVYLFMHHPPFDVGLPNMDKDKLANSDEFLKVIKPHKHRIRHIFFGHLHRSVSGSWQGVSYSCPPSPVHQTPLELENAKPGYVSPEPPVYQLVDIHNDSDGDRVVVHSHHFLHDAPAINSRTCYRYQKPAKPE
ncbi:phosphodiesterase [Endozoicomonas sp. OPT23]|uniref:phosphodiesterase n=1 Tax=Endozoicomonas sp. OPT23 TaxID=2072845 RepID=UPI00129AD6C6|nr:phosphodiesterase [Endozoicomonas sp. OPT23]MRI33006.1 phosphodiesterase [Endozoicomonas sp. OPT23]